MKALVARTLQTSNPSPHASLWMDSDELDQYGTKDDMDFVVHEGGPTHNPWGKSIQAHAHLRSDNPTADTEAKKESQVTEEDNEVIPQLNQTKAAISIWCLLMESKSHHDPILSIQTPSDKRLQC